MIDPHNITDYNRNDWDLQEFFFFAVAVAGKKSETTARKVQNLTDHISEMLVENPYYEKHRPETGIIHYLVGINDIQNAGLNLLKAHKFGKYKQWEQFLEWWSQMLRYMDGACLSDWLREASVRDLEQIPSVGKKTSRFFKLHSDPEADCVPLDTHILKFVRDKVGDMGRYIPKTTPTSIHTYANIEGIAKVYMGNYMEENKLQTLAQADLEIWRGYASNA
jgi:hypothetical protein